ncbi:ribokinase [Brevibacterium iodinum ATCC 49514]|uniref:Ribokinase n=1 Tax=Brevibacterium iodinum ATCC 49514 TaxID=1255616 RepID=A0A2H1IB17_9MICO|nr:ribokinase [Brevibacterium iodinum]SMX72408.1 ribokinase [Brevibacterium iodinum ATCC 49514]SUW13175.1 Ribokinase [Brevibacterium iodinum]
MTIDCSLTVVGSINADLTATTTRLPAAGETVGGGRLSRSPGGKGANQAAAAARLGARTRMIGAVGADSDGQAMLHALRAAGVNTDDIAEVAAETGAALIMVDADGENQIAVCEGANASVSLDGIEFGADEAVLTQLEISLDLISELATRVPGFLAVNAAPALPLPAEVVDRADLIIVNEYEHSQLPQLQTAKLVAVTYGAKGSALLARGEQIAFAEAVPAKPVSTVGAGDAYCAALTLGLTSGLEPERALRAANAVGAAVVKVASAQPQFDRFETYLSALD